MDIKDLRADLESLKGTGNKTVVSSKEVTDIGLSKGANAGIVKAQELDSFTPEELKKSNVNAFTAEKFCQLMGAALKNRGLDTSNVAVVTSAELDRSFSPNQKIVNNQENELDLTTSVKNRKTF